MSLLELEKVKIDGGTQPRAKIDEAVVAEYAEAMEEGATFPPVVVFADGAIHWLADGFHRFHATRRVGFTQIEADIRTGGITDAALFAAGCNQTHGLRRSNDDKRCAVKLVFAAMRVMKENWSDREIAKRAGVSHNLAANIRVFFELASNASSNRTGSDGKRRSLPPSRPKREYNRDPDPYAAERHQDRMERDPDPDAEVQRLEDHRTKERLATGITRADQIARENAEHEAREARKQALAMAAVSDVGPDEGCTGVDDEPPDDEPYINSEYIWEDHAEEWRGEIWAIANRTPRSAWPMLAGVMRDVLDEIEKD